MDITFLKKSTGIAASDKTGISETVQSMLAAIEAGGEAATREHARRLDAWEGKIVVSRDEIDAAAASVPVQLRDDIRYAHDNIARFAQAQLSSISDMEVELRPGLIAGQKHIPVASVGAYVPGGRYAHLASALMTVTTASVAGVAHIAACSPPRGANGIPPAILYALDLCGAQRILTLGGVQGVAALAFGQFGCMAADVLAGPGNAYVAEAKRLLYGRVGIDMVAGPTDSLILADASANARIVATDLVSQAEHGGTSPVWLATTSRPLADAVMALVPELLAALPEHNRTAAEAAWRDLGEVMLCETREAMAAFADTRAPEHLHVQARDLDWWQQRLRNYGSLFLGEETTVAFGDKVAGPNHVLPTSGAARYTGGLSVHKFLKIVTWQRASRDAVRELAPIAARISRLEGMEAHSRAADVRLASYFPGESFSLTPEETPASKAKPGARNRT